MFCYGELSMNKTKIQISKISNRHKLPKACKITHIFITKSYQSFNCYFNISSNEKDCRHFSPF